VALKMTVVLPPFFMNISATQPENNMSETDKEPDLWDQVVMDGVNGDTGMTPDAVFVREYVKTGDAMLATSRAGLNDSRYTLSVLAEHHLRRPEIQAAIEITRELRIYERPVVAEYTRELIVDDLEKLHQKASDDGAYAPAISAKKVQAQLLGYLDQTVNVRHSVEPREMTTDELRRRIAEMSRDDGALPAPYTRIEAQPVEVPSIIEAEYVEVKGEL
jgi:phage terminase small subunit